MSDFTARYPGHCHACPTRIAPGDPIKPAPGRSYGYVHADCPAQFWAPPRRLRLIPKPRPRYDWAAIAEVEEARQAYAGGLS